MLAYAILAPNPHNIQPWLIKLNDQYSFDLFVDQQRLLPETDPFARQIHIGQGCFLETLTIAATAYGFKAEIDYFPQGEYSNRVIESLPVARVVLTKSDDVKTDPLFVQLLKRQSNKREYDNSRLNPAQKSQLQALADTTQSSFTLVDSEPDGQYLQRVLTEAMAVESGHKARDLETINMFRFNDQEVQKFRDGFGLEHAGVSGIKKIMLESFFLDREKTQKDPSEFAKQSVDITRSISASTSSFAWITTKGNSRLQQVKAGRDYCRLNLTTAAMGLAQHPMSQVLEEYEDMLDLQQQFKQHFQIKEHHTVQMLVRLGKAEKTVHTPRRLVSSLVLG
ncbi:Acg family FMN-binding oxidoreductase [Psychromonas ossibalaenae]|uniref:Acg family FMN-binding oxidoreductase n=1 Tax=Psychromonas ossibalaenae TaxID=444922 RepID=UPI0003731408|nr:hypothetical protein [Psychromonas ossibalaenae]